MYKVLTLVGSLRNDSHNFKLAKALETLAAGRLAFEYADLGALPHYNDELWAKPPESVTHLKKTAEAADAVLIAMPEINRSFPSFLKNALDWASRPYGQNSWHHKPLGVVGTSPGAVGTAAGQAHLRSILPVYGFVLMGQPEVYLQYRPDLIGEDYSVTDETTAGFLGNYVDRFVEWIDLHGAHNAVRQAAE